MSQINRRQNIRQINEIRSSMVNLQAMSEYEPMQLNCSEFESICPDNIFRAINAVERNLTTKCDSPTICSPAQLAAEFSTTFSKTVTSMERQALSPVEARKAAMIKTLSQGKILTSKKQSWDDTLEAVINADNLRAVNKEVKIAFQKIEATHTKGYAVNLANACVEAGKSVGFEVAEIKPVNGKLEVISTNSIGQRVISEISVDKHTGQVHASTETIGITDGSCSDILQRFNAELKKMGVRWMEEEVTFTGDNCKLPYSNVLKKQDEQIQKRREEQKRSRKLNSNRNLRH